MYAVIQTGGKQERVQLGDFVQIEKLEGDVGSKVTFDQVLFLSKGNSDAPEVVIGKPLVAQAKVEAEIVGQGRGEKILIIKMKRRKQYRRTQGHRQYYTQVLITKVDGAAFGSAALEASDREKKLASFQSHLAPKGPAFTPKTIGSRERLRRLHAQNNPATDSSSEATATQKAAPKSAAPKKSAAKKSTGAKKTAAKKTAAKKSK